MTNFEKVKQFMSTFGQEVKDRAEFPDDRIVNLRIKLIEEELQELKDAIKNKDIVEVADALTDILVVTYGGAVAWGLEIDKCFNEVHRSNMSKLSADGKPIYNDYCKVMKGPNYSPPDLKKFI